MAWLAGAVNAVKSARELVISSIVFIRSALVRRLAMKRILNAFDKTADLIMAAKYSGDKSLKDLAERTEIAIDRGALGINEIHRIMCNVRKDGGNDPS